MDNPIFVTSNMNKLREAESILGRKLNHISLDLPELQGSPETIIKAKAASALEQLGKPCFVDDTSLAFTALDGLPGPYIRDFLERLGTEKLPRLLDGFSDKTATVICCIGYAEPGEKPVTIRVSVQGTIVEPRGTTNFGWDPIFQPKNQDKTYAEMTEQEKNEVSHRTLVLKKFKEFLDKRN